MAAENALKTAGRRFAMLHAVLQPGMSDNPAKFETPDGHLRKSLLDKAGR